MSFPLACLRWIFVLLSVASFAAAQDRAPELAQARERWERMSPAERERIAKRFEEFRELPQEQRERMGAHLRRIDEARREIEAGIPEELRAKLATLPPDARRQVLREYVETSMGERAERLRNKMSPELLSQLESATPAQREELLRARREELRQRGAPHALRFLARAQGLPPEEVERLKALPPKEMLAAVEQLGRREIERRGPPPGVDPAEFKRWLEMPPHELMERMQRHGGCDFRGPGEHAGPPDGPRGPGEPGGGPGGWQGRRNGEGKPEGERGPRRASKLTEQAQAQVFSALRPDRQWIVELAEQTPEARRAEIGVRIRTRVVEVLRNQPGLDPQAITRLESLEGREFMEGLREIVGDPPSGFGEHFRSGQRGGGPGRGEDKDGGSTAGPDGERRFHSRPPPDAPPAHRGG